MKHIVNLAITSLLIGILFLASACQRKIKTPAQEAPTIVQTPPAEKPMPSVSSDPYFQGHSIINSPFGPSTITRNILEDRQGNIWFATWEGIVRYDGSTFTNLTNEQNLNRTRAFSLLEDRAGVVWVGTLAAGLYRYDPKGDPGLTSLNAENGLQRNGAQCLYEDGKGNLWIGSGDGLSCYDGKGFRLFTKDNGMPDADINSMIEDASGNLWIAARGEACIYDGKSFSTILRENNLPFTNVRSLLKDQTGRIWLGGQDGLWYFDGSYFTQVDDNFVGYLYQDRAGNLWVSRSKPDSIYEMELVRYDLSGTPLASIESTPISDPQGQVFGVVEDKQGRIWFGTEAGAMRYDGTTFTDFQPSQH